MTAPDGKQRLTDVANTEQLLRLVQSIPSPKAEPFKQWLARVGYPLAAIREALLNAVVHRSYTDPNDIPFHLYGYWPYN